MSTSIPDVLLPLFCDTRPTTRSFGAFALPCVPSQITFAMRTWSLNTWRSTAFQPMDTHWTLPEGALTS
ncbi:TPA: hypothetical protein NKU37_002932 [Vibrio parahaemolyticus]|nr:hypothetical protein [Vibrio parahaemolyticus]